MNEEQIDASAVAAHAGRGFSFGLAGLILFVLFAGSTGLLLARLSEQPWVIARYHAPAHHEIPGYKFAIVYTNPGYLLRAFETGKALGTFTGPVKVFGGRTHSRCAILEKSTSTARIFDSVAEKELCSIPLVNGEMDSFNSPFSPDGSRIALLSTTGTFNVWDTSSGQLVSTLSKPYPIYWYAYCPDGNSILLPNCTWDSRSQTIVPLSTGYRFPRFTPDGQAVFLRGEKECGTWDLQTGQKLASLPPIAYWEDTTFSPDGKRILLRAETMTHVCEVATGKTLFDIPTDSAAMYSPDGTQLLACNGGSAIFFDASTGKELARVSAAHAIEAATFSPDGSEILTTSVSCLTRIYDAKTLAQSYDLDFAGIGKAQYDRYGRIIAWDADCIAILILERRTDARRGIPYLAALTIFFGALCLYRVGKWLRSRLPAAR